MGLTARLAQEWKAAGVRLFCLVPGTVLTAGVGEELAGSVLGAAIEASLLRRDTSVAEVAEWVAALGSGLFDAVSGTVIEIDGGATLTDAPSVLLAPDGGSPNG
jgi:citronellol/citronellal dehydrogenase